MTTDENIMKEMLDRATNPSRETVDELSLQMFCMVVRSNSQLVDKAQELILSKIRSNDVTESTRAISLLEECMTMCGTEFQNEISKFRFLNELIRLVSKKYRGAETSTAVKQRIMECLLLWTTEFPQKDKIGEVYDMLKKEGVEHSTTPAAEAKRESVLGIDEEMLAKLIKSNDPENFKRANLLIQYRVNQESRRTDMLLQHKSILQEVENTISLLNQMLDTFEADGYNETDGNTNETLSLMRDLYEGCKKHKPILERLPALMENLDEPLIIETVETNDLLQAVMRRYKSIIPKEAAITVPSVASTSVTNVVTTTAPKLVQSTVASNADLLSDLLGVAPIGTNVPATSTLSANDVKLLDAVAIVSSPSTAAATARAKSNTLDELNAIFGEGETVTANTTESTKNLNEIFSGLQLLEPISVFSAKEVTDLGAGGNSKMNGLACGTEKRAFRELPAIDKLSEDLFKESLQTGERVSTFKKEPERYTLNDLVKERTQSKPTSLTTTPVATPNKKFRLQLVEDEKCVEENKNLDDDMMLTVQSEATNIESKSDEKEPHECAQENSKNQPLRHLSEITVDLDDVIPTSDEHVLMDDDDVKLTLNFTENRPSKHVTLIVLTACNKSKLPVQDFQFEASVRKPCKVRLLPPTAISMPPHKPFRPAAPINQVMLLLNPTRKAVDVTCIIGYKLGDDPDPIKESIVAKNIPFVE